MQGDIESVAAMSPKDLTDLFELISGSEAFRKPYEELETKKNAADDHLRYVFSKKKTVVAERKQKLEQKTEAEKHLKMQQELVRHLHALLAISILSHPVLPCTSFTTAILRSPASRNIVLTDPCTHICSEYHCPFSSPASVTAYAISEEHVSYAG